MKKYLAKISSLIILFILIIATHYSSYAAGDPIDTDITTNTFLQEFDPNGSTSSAVDAISSPITSAIIDIVNPVVGTIQVIGGILTVISIAMYGFRAILASNLSLAKDLGFEENNPQELKHFEEFARYLLIGSVILFSSSTLVNFILKVLI